MTKRALMMTLAAVVVLAAAGFLLTPQSDAQRGGQGGGPRFRVGVYAAKFLCGELTEGAPSVPPAEGPVVPGHYQTAINLHNPNRVPVVLGKKAVLMFEGFNPVNLPPEELELPRPPGEMIFKRLDPDFGMEIDCQDIREELLGMVAIPPSPALPFIKGVVVIEVFGVLRTGPFDPDADGRPLILDRGGDPPFDVIEVLTVQGNTSGTPLTVLDGVSISSRVVFRNLVLDIPPTPVPFQTIPDL